MRKRDNILLMLIINALIGLNVSKEELRVIISDDVYTRINDIPDLNNEELMKELKGLLKTYIKKLEK